MNDLLRVLLAIFIPPVGVLCQTGLKPEWPGWHFWINLGLCVTGVGYPIALCHALYVILRDSND